jgi:hypothetical protein
VPRPELRFRVALGRGGHPTRRERGADCMPLFRRRVPDSPGGRCEPGTDQRGASPQGGAGPHLATAASPSRVGRFGFMRPLSGAYCGDFVRPGGCWHWTSLVHSGACRSALGRDGTIPIRRERRRSNNPGTSPQTGFIHRCPRRPVEARQPPHSLDTRRRYATIA